MSPIRVAIADDHPIVREGLQRVVNGCPDLEVVGEVTSGDDVLDLCARVRPDVLLLDISMPGPGFLEVLRTLRRTPSMPAVLVLSVHSGDVFAQRALEAGASGFLSKEQSPEALTNAIRTVAAGGSSLAGASGATTPVARGRDRQHLSPQSRLSPREFQVFLMLGRGMRVTEIAQALGLSPKTVSTHRSRILEKTRLGGNSAIVAYVSASRLLD
jgi:DNA-binding NarL/FixJ family response regulator